MGINRSIAVHELDNIQKYLDTPLGEKIKNPKVFFEFLEWLFGNDIVDLTVYPGYRENNPNYQLKYTQDEIEAYKFRKCHILNSKNINRYRKYCYPEIETENDKNEFMKSVNMIACTKLGKLLKKYLLEDMIAYVPFETKLHVDFDKIFNPDVIEAMLKTAYDKKIIDFKPLVAFRRLVVDETSAERYAKKLTGKALVNKPKNELYLLLKAKRIKYAESEPDIFISFIGVDDSLALLDAIKRAWLENWEIDIERLRHTCCGIYKAKEYKKVKYVKFKDVFKHSYWGKSNRKEFEKFIKKRFKKPIFQYWQS